MNPEELADYLKRMAQIPEDLTYILVASSFFQDVHKYLE
jgi:hypothetical protein